MNVIVLSGNLGKDPEIRYTQDQKAVASFSLAVRRRFSKDGVSDWFDCSSFGKTAEFVEKYLHKGSKVIVSGELQNNNYTDKNGVKRRDVRVIVGNVDFAESKKDGAATAPNDGEFMKIDPAVDDDEIPFQ